MNSDLFFWLQEAVEYEFVELQQKLCTIIESATPPAVQVLAIEAWKVEVQESIQQLSLELKQRAIPLTQEELEALHPGSFND